MHELDFYLSLVPTLLRGHAEDIINVAPRPTSQVYFRSDSGAWERGESPIATISVYDLAFNLQARKIQLLGRGIRLTSRMI